MGIAQALHGLEEAADVPLSQLLPGAVDDGGILRDKAAYGAVGVQQALPLQFHQCSLHGVGVDAGLCGQIPDRGELFSRGQLAGDNARFQLFDQLGIDRGVAVKDPFHGADTSLSYCPI